MKKIDSGTIAYNIRGVSCRWGKKKVSESVYNAKLDKLFSYSGAKRFADLKYNSKAKVKSKLQ